MKLPPQLQIPTPPAPLNRTYWVIEGKLLAGAYPGNLNPEQHTQRLTDLLASGMRTFINLMEEQESNNNGIPFVRYDSDLRELAKSQGIAVTHLRFPISDGGITTPDRMRSILDAIDLSLQAQQPVYMHCFGGMGRTGTAVCCWLLRHALATHDNVLSVLTRLRQADTERASWPTPENQTQENFILNWRAAEGIHRWGEPQR